MYAIIVTGGKQYRVEQGDIVYIEKLDVEADSEVKFDNCSIYRKRSGARLGKTRPPNGFPSYSGYQTGNQW